MSGSPEELLRSALEKIVFFECRVSSLEHELDAARAIAVRARDEAQGARRREGELEGLLAQARGEQSVATVHSAELADRVRLLEAERERFLTGMVERARVTGAPAADDGDAGSEVDLAGFISELRGEIESLRAWKRAAEEAGARVEEAGATSAASGPSVNASSAGEPLSPTLSPPGGERETEGGSTENATSSPSVIPSSNSNSSTAPSRLEPSQSRDPTSTSTANPTSPSPATSSSSTAPAPPEPSQSRDLTSTAPAPAEPSQSRAPASSRDETRPEVRRGERGQGSTGNLSSPSPRESGGRVGERGEPTKTPIPNAIRAISARTAPCPTPVPRSGASRTVDSLSTLASRMGAQGRLAVDPGYARSLAPAFTTRSERALYESLDDLASSDADARRRAADCLRVLGSSAATPLVAAALGREPDAAVKAALLAALGALAEPAAADLAARELDDPRPPVRAAALEAAAALGKARAVPHLARALGDASALVRRRAVILLGFAAVDDADEALASALSDRDAGVARAAAAALAGRPSARAQGALAKALDHREPAVRAAASRAVARWAGEAPDAAAPQDERRRASRRITEKLLGIDDGALRSAVTRVPCAPSRRTEERLACRPPPMTGRAACSPSLSKGEGRAGGGAAVATATAAVTLDLSLCDAAVAELRAALRGRTPDEIASALGRDRPSVEAALTALVQGGRAARRGPRFYTS